MSKKLQVLADPTLVNFFEMDFKKKLQVSDQPTLVFFLTFFEKIYKCWIKGKLSKSQTKWTGLTAHVTGVQMFTKEINMTDKTLLTFHT